MYYFYLKGHDMKKNLDVNMNDNRNIKAKNTEKIQDNQKESEVLLEKNLSTKEGLNTVINNIYIPGIKLNTGEIILNNFDSNLEFFVNNHGFYGSIPLNLKIKNNQFNIDLVSKPFFYKMENNNTKDLGFFLWELIKNFSFSCEIPIKYKTVFGNGYSVLQNLNKKYNNFIHFVHKQQIYSQFNLDECLKENFNGLIFGINCFNHEILNCNAFLNLNLSNQFLVFNPNFFYNNIYLDNYLVFGLNSFQLKCYSQIHDFLDILCSFKIDTKTTLQWSHSIDVLSIINQIIKIKNFDIIGKIIRIFIYSIFHFCIAIYLKFCQIYLTYNKSWILGFGFTRKINYFQNMNWNKNNTSNL